MDTFMDTNVQYESAEVLINSYNKVWKEFLFKNGWKYYYNSSNKKYEWICIYSAGPSGKCYTHPISKHAGDVHVAMMQHRVWEESGDKFEEYIERLAYISNTYLLGKKEYGNPVV